MPKEKLSLIFEKAKKSKKNYFHTSLYCLKKQEPTFLHYHDVLEIGMCLHGSGKCFTSDGEMPFSEGDVQIFPPFVPHYSVSETDNTLWVFVNIDTPRISSRSITVNPAFLIELVQKIQASGIFKEEDSPSITRLLRDIVTMMRAEPSDDGTVLELITAKLCELLLELSLSDQKNTFIVENARKTESVLPAIHLLSHRIENEQPISVSEMATQCFMSESYFRRLFTSIIGEPPKAYIVKMQMQKAAGLLLSTKLPVSRISKMCCFEDNSTFYRCFVKTYGKSPTAYRNKR